MEENHQAFGSSGMLLKRLGLCSHTSSLEKFAKERGPIDPKWQGSGLVGIAGMPKCMGWGCAEPSPSLKAEQSLHTGWFSTEDFPPQPSTQCLDLLLLCHTSALTTQPQGKAWGA